MPAPCARAWQPACGTLRRIAPNPRRCRAIRARAHGIAGSENRVERQKLRAKEPPGLQRNPLGSGLTKTHFARGKNRGLRKFAVSGKLSVAKHIELPGN